MKNKELEYLLLKYKEKFGKFPKGYGDGTQQTLEEYMEKLRRMIDED